MRGKPGDRIRLLHIRDAIHEIETYIENRSISDLESNSMLRNAVIKQLEIIGEAVNNLSQSLKERCPEVDWKAIVAMRNILIHEYFAVSVKILWDTITENLPDFRNSIEKLIVNEQ